jgi:hypothetical protein
MTLALVAGFFGLVGAASQTAPAPDVVVPQIKTVGHGGRTNDCFVHRVRDSDAFLSSRVRDGYVSVTVTSRHCTGRTGHHWEEPISYTVTANYTGGRINCGSWNNYFQGFKWNALFWDGNGTKYNPHEFTTACQSDTYTIITRSLRHAPIMRYCDRPPRWQVKVTQMKWAANDRELTLGGKLWGWTGPVRQFCM